MNKVKDRHFEENSPPMIKENIRLDQLDRITPKPATVLTLLFMVLMIGAEEVTIFVGALPGAILHGILLFSLVNFSYFSRTPQERQIYLSLSLLSLLRILSLAMPIPQVAPIYWYVIVGSPLLLAVILATRVTSFASLKSDIGWKRWINQLFFGLSGIPLGWIASNIVRTKPLILTSSQEWVILAGVILSVIAAITEEVIFRGIIQKALKYPFGFLSFSFSGLLYASMFLGTLSLTDVVFFGSMGLLFGLWVQISNSLWGTVIAHSLMNVVFLLAFSLH